MNTDLQELVKIKKAISEDLHLYKNVLSNHTITELLFRLEVLGELIEIERRG